ncbi:MAG: hypothetical protein SNH73_02400 [Rikenellaceae bacterium]
MNKVFTSIILTLGLFTSVLAQNTGGISQTQDPSEIIELSSYIDGNYSVDRLLVMESTPTNNEFVVHYKINITKLISTYSNNSSEIAGLRSFIESVQSDSLKRITNFDIVGYASPDGPAALNKRLAAERAKDFSTFLDTECNMSGYERTVTSRPYMWIDTKSALMSSSVPNKSDILAAIESDMSQSEIESKLKAHTSSWDYIKNNILPDMRCVEIQIKYNSWKVVENRTLIEEQIPVDVQVATGGGRGSERCDRDIADDYIYCLLVEMPGQEIDFDCDKETEKLKIGKHGAKYKERGKGEREKIKERKKRGFWRSKE